MQRAANGLDMAGRNTPIATLGYCDNNESWNNAKATDNSSLFCVFRAGPANLAGIQGLLGEICKGRGNLGKY